MMAGVVKAVKLAYCGGRSVVELPIVGARRADACYDVIANILPFSRY